MDQEENIKLRYGVVCCPRCGGGIFEREQEAIRRERVVLYDPDENGHFDIQLVKELGGEPVAEPTYRCAECKLDFASLEQLSCTAASDPNEETIAEVKCRLTDNRWPMAKRYLIIGLDGTGDWNIVGAADSMGEARRAVNDGDVDRAPEFVVDLHAEPEEALYMVSLRVEEVRGPHPVN